MDVVYVDLTLFGSLGAVYVMLEIEEVVLWWFEVVHCQRWRLLVQYYWVLRLIGVILYIYLLIFVLRPFSFLQEEGLNIRR